MNSIEWLLEVPKKNRGKTFLIDELSQSEITFEQLDNNACLIGGALKNLGFKKGEKLAIFMHNSLELVKLYFGCLYSGIVVVPINPVLTDKEIERMIYDSDSKAVVVSNKTLPRININKLKEKKINVINLNKKKESTASNEKIIQLKIEELKNNPNFRSFQGVVSKDEMVIIYTSGTTSEPKAVEHRISDLVENARLFGSTLDIGPENRFCNMLSLTYLGGFYNLLLLPYVLGSSVVLTQTFDPKIAINFWKSIVKHGVNTLWLVPSIMSILMELDRSNEGINYCKNNVKLVLAGTAPLQVKLRKDFEKKYGVNVYENYGLAETFFISTNSPSYPIQDDSVGKILKGISIRIVNNQGEDVKEGNAGEIFVKTPYLMKGYYNSKKYHSKPVSNNEWFETGDFGIVKDTTLQITGRKKDLIIRGGINISPMSIENVFYKHPDVLECSVLGIPHKFQGEEIVGVIRIKKIKDFEKVKSELFNICNQELSKIKQPSQIILLHGFPHSTYGKIQKNKIRNWLLQNQKTTHALQKKSLEVIVDKSYKIVPSKIVTQSIEALSIKYNTEVYEKQRRGEDVIVMSLGEAFFEIPLFSFEDLPVQKIYHYSHSRGIPELRQKLAKYFFDTYDIVFDYEKEILITAGSKIAIHMCLMSLINPGDEVILHEPAWVSYPEQIKLCYGIPIQVPYHKSVFDFEEYITNKTKMIIINNPNNPTGKVYTLDELTYLYQLAKKYQIYILSDEAYSDFILNQDEFISLANLDIKKEHSVIINSISKNFGLSGWRMGYMVTNSDLINQLLKINQHLITCAPTILEYYVAKYFDDIINITKPQIKQLVRKRQEVVGFMNLISLKSLPGNTTFYFFISIENSKLSSEEFCSNLLHNYHVSTVPGIGYGKSCDKFIRISIGAENIERIQKGLKAIRNLISKTSS